MRWKVLEQTHLSCAGLLLQELAAYSNRPSRIRLMGPSICVGRDAGHRLAMAVHELATNASKYGAFANVSGRLDVKWELRQYSPQLNIEWREIGGPPVEEPIQRGFGTRLLQTVVEQQLQGTPTMKWEPDGFRCLISLLMENIAPD